MSENQDEQEVRPGVGCPVSRVQYDDRETPGDRINDGIRAATTEALDMGLVNALGLALLVGGLGYLLGLNRAIHLGYAPEGMLLDPAAGVFSGALAAGVGALVLGYNIGWMAAAPEGEDE